MESDNCNRLLGFDNFDNSHTASSRNTGDNRLHSLAFYNFCNTRSLVCCRSCNSDTALAACSFDNTHKWLYDRLDNSCNLSACRPGNTRNLLLFCLLHRLGNTDTGVLCSLCNTGRRSWGTHTLHRGRYIGPAYKFHSNFLHRDRWYGHRSCNTYSSGGSENTFYNKCISHWITCSLYNKCTTRPLLMSLLRDIQDRVWSPLGSHTW